jgi:hypothetical protein
VSRPNFAAGRDRAQLYALRSRWGTLRVVEGTDEAPVILERRTPLGTFEVWRHESGTGSKAWFERRTDGEN